MDLGKKKIYVRASLMETSQGTHFLLLSTDPRQRQARTPTSPSRRQGFFLSIHWRCGASSFVAQPSTSYKSHNWSPMPLSQLIKVILIISCPSNSCLLVISTIFLIFQIGHLSINFLKFYPEPVDFLYKKGYSRYLVCHINRNRNTRISK